MLHLILIAPDETWEERNELSLIAFWYLGEALITLHYDTDSNLPCAEDLKEFSVKL